MKLISCYIENYGKISQTSFVFNSELTSFCEANGYGKTTLASFLKAMFFGLDSDKANSGFNERRHFNPFGGGRFGGNLNFVSDEKEFKIERYFDEKSETKDTVSVYCNGKKISFDGIVGERLFGIDKQSFERTIFITGAEIEIASTSSINTKLNNFLEGSDDNTNLDAALKRLESKSKDYKKSRLGNDLITLQTNKINKLSEEIKNVEAIACGLPAKYEELQEKNRAISELGNKITRAQSENLIINNWEHYDGLNEEINKKKAFISDIKNRYPYGIPTKEETQKAYEAAEKDNTLRASGRQKLFTEEDMAKYSAYQAEFYCGIPDEAVLADTGKEISNLAEISHEIELSSQTKPSPKENMLRQKFAYHVPDAEETDKLDKTFEKFKEAEEEYGKIPDFIQSTDSVYAPNKKSFYKPPLLRSAIASAFLSASLILVSVLLFLHRMIPYGALSAVGAAASLAMCIILFKKSRQITTQTPSLQIPNPEKTAAGKKKDNLYTEIQAFLLPYGYSFENGAAFAVAKFKEDIKEFLVLENSQKELEEKLNEKMRQKKELEEKLTFFFARYQINGNGFVNNLSKLQSDIDAYRLLQARKANSAENEKILQQKIEENSKYIFAFCQKYRENTALISDRIKQISKDSDDYETAKTELNLLEDKAAKFKEAKSLTERPENGFTDLQELNERLAHLQEEKNSLFTEITDDERESEKYEDLKNNLERSEQKLKEYKSVYDLLSKTVSSLKQAEQNLKDKIVKPIKDRFVYYSSLLEKAIGEKITMDADFKIRYERNGVEKSEKHLSSGQRSICAFCFRLALIDNMYSEEKPFLILDDPFANLDELHMDKVRILINELSKKLQIIYFSCHPSRALGGEKSGV